MVGKMRIFVVILLSLLFLPVFSHAQDQRGLKVSDAGIWGEYYALIIGINGYKEWARLQTAVNDAIGLKKILIQRYNFNEKNVVLRINDQAHRLRLLRDLRDMASNLGTQDNLLIYFAGHGQLDDLTGDGYWIPVEGKLKDPGTWISHSMLKNVLSSERVKGKNIVVIADSCYSGSLLRGGPGLLSISDQGYRQKLISLSSLRSRQVITSGGLEPVADGGRDGHSLFTYYFLKALKENPSDVIDIENLIHSRVWKHVAQIGGQRPSIGRLKSPMDEDGQFVLVSSRSSVPGTTQVEKPSAVASQGKIRSTNEQYEILFWESSKDSNNLLTYQDYLEKFPNGTFAELARINIQKLSGAGSKSPAKAPKGAKAEKSAKAPKPEKKASTSKMQAKVAAPAPKVTPPVPSASKTKAILSDQRAQLGVFPWKLTGSASRWNFIALDALADVVNRHKNRIVARYSYYEIKTKPKPELIEEQFFTKGVVQKLWSGSGGGPNAGYARQLGQQLGIDVAIICDIDGRIFDPDPGTYKIYVVDVHSGQVYQGRVNTKDIEGEGDDRFIKLSEKLFQQYFQYAGIPSKGGKAVAQNEKKNAQASLTPVVSKTAGKRSVDSKIYLGVFPWKLTGSASRWNFIALDALTTVVKRHKNEIIAQYTHYEIKTKPKPNLLDEDFFTQDVIRKLWSGPGGGPHIGYVREIAQQLDVDVVILCDIDGRIFDPDPGTYKMYVVDVHSGRVYKGRTATRDIEGEGEARFEELTQRLLAEFIQNR